MRVGDKESEVREEDWALFEMQRGPLEGFE